jgi:uncharacterized membrane protein
MNLDFLTKFIVVLIIILIIDFLWLGLIAKNFYAKELGSLMKKNIVWVVAILVYILLALGILVFVLKNNLTLNQTIGLGALFGLIVYSVYDLTNYSVLAKYSLKLTIIDIIWGTFLCGATSGLTKLIINNFF